MIASSTGIANGTSLSINRPAGVAQDDILIAQITVKDVQAITAPAAAGGWNLVDSTSTGTAGNEITQAVYWRFVGVLASEPASYAWSWPSGARASGGISAFRNVDLVDPIDVSGVTSTDTSSTITLPTLTTSSSNAMLVALLGASRASNAHSAATGMTEEYEVNSGAGPNGTNVSMDSQLQASAGSTGAKSASSGNAVDNVAHLIALRANGASLTIAVPPGTAINDVMVASVAVRPCAAAVAPCTVTINAPAGWTSLGTVDQTSGGSVGNRLAMYWRVATAADPGASYTWALVGTPAHTGAVGGIASFSGVDTTSPIVASAGQATASSRSHAAPSINTGTVTNTVLVSTHAANASASWASPAGMSEALDIAALPLTNNAGISLQMNYEARAAAGATGTRTATFSNPPAANSGATHMLALRPMVTLAHYAIAVSSSTVATCDYAQITISGHDASHNLVNPPSGRSLTLGTSLGSGVWQAGPLAGTGAWTPSGANNGVATYVWPGGESSFTVRLRQSAVSSLSVNLNDGSVVEAALEDPTISFVNSAFRISNGANGAATIGTQIAGKASNTGFGAQTLYLQAVRTDTATGACVSLFPSGSDVLVEVGAQCNNPASCGQPVTLASSAAAGNTAVFVPNGLYPASMNFRFTTGNAEAPFALNYVDAGQITLQFRYPLPSPPAGQYVQGASNAFVVRPFGLAFSGVGHDDTPSGLAATLVAGDDFSMTVGAYAWAAIHDLDNDGVPDSGKIITGNTLTPNFAAATTAGVAPGGNLAGVDGTLTRAGAAPAITAAEWSGGTAVINNWRYSEVGNVRLTAAANDYLGDANADVRGDSSNDGTVGTIGRFRPKRFVVSAAGVTTRLDAACAPASPFTYMNERLRLSFTLTAQNTQGATTANYTGAYARLVLTSFGSWDLGARDGATDLSTRLEDPGLAAPPTGSWLDGVASGVTVTTALRRALTPDNPDGPYEALQFGIAPIDSDLTAMNTLDLGTRKNIGVTTKARYGRLRMDNALGSEAHRLAVPMRVEYWNGTGFTTNLADDCTSIGRSAIALAFTPPSNLTACETAVDADPLTFRLGVAALGLTAPGANNSGSVVLTANLGSAGGSYCNPGSFVAAGGAPLSYLLGRWNASDDDGDANTAYDDKPSARAAFGLYGSQPGNFIYFRESYQ